MNTLPKDYVILGHIKDINVPKSWETIHGYNDELAFAWRYIEDGGSYWRFCYKGWLSTHHKNIILAALPNTPLYNMNLPKKSTRARPTVKQVKELENKILSLEVANTLLETEVKQLREQLAAISEIIKG